MTLLSLATINGEEDVAKFLIGKGADPDLADSHGRTALHHAVLQDCPKICRLLIDAGADPTIRDANGMTPADLPRDNESRLIATAAFEARALESEVRVAEPPAESSGRRRRI